MTYEEARDEIYSVFLAAWGNRPVIWSDMFSRVPDETQPWARVILRHTLGEQGSLSGVSGSKVLDRGGILLVQVFTPSGRGQTISYELAQLVSNAFVDAKKEVWFRNTRISEKGVNGSSYQIDVLTDFLYNEVR